MTTEYTVTREDSVITIHEDDHNSAAVATFVGSEGEQLFDLLVARSRDALTFWDANQASYL